MGKKVTFTRKQMEHIMECNGIPQEKYDEILEATTCGSVSIQGNHGEPIVKGSWLDIKKGDESLIHQKKGGVSCERLKESVNEDEVDENWKGAALGAALGAASVLGGGSQANATPTASQDHQAAQKTQVANVPLKFTEDELIKIFPQAYKDRFGKPEQWNRNRVKYEGKLPNNKISFVGHVAASEGKNPWYAILNQYLNRSSQNTIAFNDAQKDVQ